MTTVQTKVLMPEKKKKVTLAQVILVTIIMLFVLICVLPIINVASVSLSSKSAILRGDVAFLPVEPTINAYKAIVRDASMIRSLFYTIELTVIYTAMAMVMTILLAYPMTKKRLRGRRLLSLFVIFTMYFNGGAIPTYLTIKNYGLINSMWSLILPGLISTYNMIILRSFISALVPQVLPSYLSICLFCFEGNVRYASILGYVGAGGLGLILNEKIGWREYSSVGMILLALFVTIFIIESISRAARKRLV